MTILSKFSSAVRSLCCGAGDPLTEPRTATSPIVPNKPYYDVPDEDAIVIIGGGVVGLSTAYNLAREVQSKTHVSNQKIILLEARPSLFTAASSHNTGCLHYGFHDWFGRDLTELGKYSFELWQSIAESNSEFLADTGYRPQSFFPIIPGTGKDERVLPNWVATGEDWDVDWGSKGVTCATVNPEGIGKWLERECAAVGVEIRTSTTATASILSESGTLDGIKCVSAKTGDSYVLPCRTLVLGAGPWTPSQVKTLFPDSTLDLHPTTNAGDWVLFQNNNPVNEKSVAVVFFDDIVHEKLEYAGRNNASIWVCGRRNFDAVLPPPGKEDEPDEKVISDIEHYSDRLIAQNQDNSVEKSSRLTIIAKGRAFRPSTTHGLPFISEIPPKYLFSSHKPRSVSSSVFIGYGHGSYGITLGMGSGKLLAQLIYGEEPDIDISKFTIT